MEINENPSSQKLPLWPKVLPILSPEQQAAREKFMQLWHEMLPKKYGMLERFNHGYTANLSHIIGSKTLEIGAGLGEHLKHENLKTQEYYCLDYRQKFCDQLKSLLPEGRIICGDIQQKQSWESK